MSHAWANAPLPDCASSTPIPIVYRKPSQDLARQAERSIVELGGCVLSRSDPAWVCTACRRRFGNAEHPGHRLAARTPAEWAELIRVMVPKPCRTTVSGDIHGGDPVTVVVQINETSAHIMLPELAWEQTHVATLKSSPFAEAPLKAQQFESRS